MENLLKNYWVFFDNSANVEDDVFLDSSGFMHKKNAELTIKQLAEIKEIKLIVLWRKRTKVCYVYKNELSWGDGGISTEIEKAYQFKTKKQLKIKEIIEL